MDNRAAKYQLIRYEVQRLDDSGWDIYSCLRYSPANCESNFLFRKETLHPIMNSGKFVHIGAMTKRAEY